MTVSEIMKKMIDFSKGSMHDITHFQKVHSFAKLIGELEGLDNETQLILEIAAITHDIACPVLRERDVKANGKDQEREGAPMVREFLRDTGLTEAEIERVAFLVGHHHTLANIEGIDWQILIEADYLVNADGGRKSRENMESTKKLIFKTATGLSLMESIYGV